VLVPFMTILLGTLLVVALAEFAIALQGGVQIGAGNHAGLLPLVQRLLDPGYLPGDFGIDLRQHHHRVFALVVAALARLLDLDTSLAVLTHLGYALLMLSLFRLCRAVGLASAGFAVVGVALATTTAFVGRGYEVNGFLGNGPIMPPLFAHAFIMMSITAVIRRKPAAALAWTGAVLLLHVQIGLVWLSTLAIAATIIGEWPTPRQLLLGATACALIGAPALLELWGLLRDGLADGGGDTLAYIAFRMPHHFAPRGLRHIVWPLVYTLVLWAWWRSELRASTANPRNARLLLAIAIAVLALSALHALDYHLLQHGLISQLQSVRLTPLISVLGAIGVAALIARLLPQPAAPWLWTLAVLIAVPSVIEEWQTRKSVYVGIVRRIDARDAWPDLCRWVRANGPLDGLYVTPPGHSGFTALAERSTVVELKVNPDGARQRDLWYRRLRDVTGGPLPDLGSFEANSLALNASYAASIATRLPELAAAYGVRYAVLPVDTQANGKELYRNASFRLLQLPANASDDVGSRSPEAHLALPETRGRSTQGCIEDSQRPRSPCPQ
jgi:hypothetical protein